MTGYRFQDSEAREAQEAMLAWLPVEFRGNRDADESGSRDGECSALMAAVLEDRARVGINVARDVHSGCGDEVVPGGERVIAVPEECYDEDDGKEEVCCFEELVAKAPSHTDQRLSNSYTEVQNRALPDRAVRHESKPGLRYQCDDTGPVEKKTRSEVHFHVVPVDVVYDEGKSMQKRKDEEGVADPSVKDLETLVRYAGDEGDPICFRCCGTGGDEFPSPRKEKSDILTIQTAYTPAPSIRCASRVEVNHRTSHLPNSMASGQDPCLWTHQLRSAQVT